jgi:hypothetical protein
MGSVSRGPENRLHGLMRGRPACRAIGSLHFLRSIHGALGRVKTDCSLAPAGLSLFRFNLESAAADQPSWFFNREWTRMDAN